MTLSASLALDLLTPEAMARLEADLVADIARRGAETCRASFSEFVKQAWPIVRPGDPLRWGWHLDAICDHLEAVHRGEIRKLLITVCPGSGKSLLVEVFWPAWMWASDPTKELVCIASDGDLALRDATRHRDLVESSWYQVAFSTPAGWTMHPTENAKHLFKTTRNGVRYSAGINGSVTGWRGHGVIMDDLLQAKDTLSTPARERALWQLGNAVQSRVNDPSLGFFVMIQQRLCIDDPAAWAIAQGDYEHLNLPTEYVPARRYVTHRTITRTNGHVEKVREEFKSDPRTEEGELLFPDFFTPEVVAAKKKNPEAFAAQDQQDPLPPGGGMFKVDAWRFWRHRNATEAPPTRDALWYQGAARILPEKFDEIAISCDATFGSKSPTASRVSILVGGRLGGDRYLLERVWDRMDFDQTERALLATFARWPLARAKIIEGKASGPGLINRLRDVHKIAGILEGDANTGNKEQRANEQLPYQRGGNCYLPEFAPWVADFIVEHGLFPGPCHLGNDDVDAWSQLLAHFETSAPTFVYPPGYLNLSTPHEED